MCRNPVANFVVKSSPTWRDVFVSNDASSVKSAVNRSEVRDHISLLALSRR